MRRLLFVLLLVPVAALGQDLSPLSPNANSVMPQCGPAMDGLAICRFGVIYECEFTSPNGLERRTGWRWTMDVMRSCDTTPAEADLPDYGQRGQPRDLTYAPEYGSSGPQSGESTMQPLPNRGRPGGAIRP